MTATAEVFHIVPDEDVDLVEEALKKYGTKDIVLLHHEIFPGGKAVRKREDILNGAPNTVRELIGKPAPASSVRGTSFTFWTLKVKKCDDGKTTQYESLISSYITPK